MFRIPLSSRKTKTPKLKVSITAGAAFDGSRDTFTVYRYVAKVPHEKGECHNDSGTQTDAAYCRWNPECIVQAAWHAKATNGLTAASQENERRNESQERTGDREDSTAQPRVERRQPRGGRQYHADTSARSLTRLP